MQLDPDDIEQIANRVAELIGTDSPRGRYVDAATLAAELGVERHWIYANADTLGAIRLGGRNGRLRFDPEEVRRRLAGGNGTHAQPASKPRRRARHPNRPAKLIRYDG